MRRAGWRRLVFLALVVLAPVPTLLFGGRVPTANLYLMSGVCTVVWVAEGATGPVRTITLLLAAHAAVYTGLLWCAAWLIERVIRRLSPLVQGLCVLGGIVIALVVALSTPIYVTPFARTARSTLLGALR